MNHWSSTPNPVWLHNVGIQHIKFLILYLSFFLNISLFSPQCLCICYFFRSFYGLSYYLGFYLRVIYLLRGLSCVLCLKLPPSVTFSILLLHCIFLHIMYHQKFVMFLPLKRALWGQGPHLLPILLLHHLAQCLAYNRCMINISSINELMN